MFENWKKVTRQLKNHIILYRRILADERTPRTARLLLWLAVGYVMMPFDLIPDFIPVIGHLDDVIIVPLLVIAALKLIPPEVVQEHRLASLQQSSE